MPARTRFFLSLLLLTTTLATAAPSPVSLQVSPRIGTAPQDVHVRVHIAPNARNRTACVIADSDNGYSSQCWDHIGVDAPVTTDVWLKQLQAGEWVVTAAVVDVEGKQKTTSETVCVVGLDSSCGSAEN